MSSTFFEFLLTASLWSLVALIVLTVTLVLYEWLSRPAALEQEGLDVERQSEEIAPGIRVRRTANKLRLPFDYPKTSYDVFTLGIERSGNGDCIGYRNSISDTSFRWLSYRQVRDAANQFGSGLLSLGVPLERQSLVGLYARNSVQWVIAEQAAATFSLVVVTLYDTLGVTSSEHILTHTALRVLIADCANLEKLLQIKASAPALQVVIAIGETPIESFRERFADVGVRLERFDDVRAMGRERPEEPRPPLPDDNFTLCFTSGTTGPAKGVMVTHRAVCKATELAMSQLKPCALLPGDTYMSYLPLSHMLERAAHTLHFAHGARIGMLTGGDVRNLLTDMQTLQPDFIAMVPRVMVRLYDNVWAAARAKGKLAVGLLTLALFFKRREVQMGIYRRNSLFDYLLFRKVQKLLGGRIRTITTGSAPVNGDVIMFIRASLGAPIFELYGQTETSFACTCQFLRDTEAEQVGPPLPEVEARLCDVAELSYNVERDGIGELCFRGPIMMKGYYKDEEKTREAIDADGWLHTGDIATWTKRGALKIVDRKKHMFKLSQGEYVAPEAVENALTQACALVAAIFVDGNSLASFTVAVVVPDEEALRRWARLQGAADVETASVDQLCRIGAFKQYLLDELLRCGAEASLTRFVIPRRVLVLPQGFSAELMTPTFKLKRAEARKCFRDELDALYREKGAETPLRILR